MLKKRINKIKTKQKQRQKQMQIVNVNIHKPTRRPREGPSQPKRNVLPTPQYIYTSQTDSLVPQMFNKEGKQQNIPTLSEQINLALDEKVNKLVSQYSKPAAQPTQQEVRQTRTETYKPNKQKMIKEYTMNKLKQEAPIKFKSESDVPLTNIQYENPVENAPILSKQEPETIFSYNTPAPISVNQAQGLEQKTGYSVKKPSSGYKSESGYKTEGTMTKEQNKQMREERLKSLLPNKPEEKIPTLTEQRENLMMQQEDNNIRRKMINEKNSEMLFKLIEENNKISKKLSKQETNKKNAPHGTKGSYDEKIKEYKSKIKSNNFKIEEIKNKNI